MTSGQEDRSTQSPDSALSPRTSEKTIKHLPKAYRKCAGRKLVAMLGTFIDKNNNTSWMCLFRFSACCLRFRARGGFQQSLASAVNRQLREEVDPPPTARPSPVRKHRRTDDLDTQLTTRMSAKLEEGDLKGAVRLASSEDTLAPMNEAPLEALEGKHPAPHSDSTIPSAKDTSQHFPISKEEVAQAICSFPKNSAGGPDGLRPQHLKDMLLDDSSRQFLLPTLASFVQLVLEGRTTLSIWPFFFGTNLTALHKKDGGIRPITLSCTLRRLVAKIATGKVKQD